MKYKLFTGAALAAVLAVSAGVAQAGPTPGAVPSDWEALFLTPADGGGDAANGGPQFGAWGFDITGMDTSVRPGDDFHLYADGGWDKRTPIPADKTRFGMFDTLFDRSQEQLKSIIETSAKSHAKPTTNAGKIGAFYNAFMDEKRIEALDAKPLAPALAKIRAIKTKDQMASFMGHSQGSYGKSVFGMGVGVDSKHPDKYAVFSGSGGLGLPDRDYYLSDNYKDKKAKYRIYVGQMLERIGWPDAQKHADEIMAFETKLAEASWTRAQRRDRDKTYNPMTPAELKAYAPEFNWGEFMKGAQLAKVDRVIVSDNTAFPKVAKIFSETSLDTLKAWEAFNTADEVAPYLSSRFVTARFNFRNKELGGQPENRVRWKRAVASVDGALGEVVGQEYVKQYFPASSKTAMEGLVGDLRAALRARIEKLDWMSPDTKAEAVKKLDKFTVKIGYPNKWRDYSGLAVSPTDLVGNIRRSGEFEYAYNIHKLGKPVDRLEWGMTPQTVNAYYNSTFNEIVFPAAILQAPFFDPKADAAINYGGVGGVIGHEMTHGFDDQGRKSDGNGVLRDWWKPEDAAKFKVQSDRYGAQYDTYEVAPGVHVKGAQTMGENIADLGGMLVALDAYHASLKGKPAPVLDGFTGDQRVFLGWAQVWRDKARLDTAKQLVAVDVHSPGQFRIVGPMRNIDAWYEAFGVKEGDKYYVKPEERVRIW